MKKTLLLLVPLLLFIQSAGAGSLEDLGLVKPSQDMILPAPPPVRSDADDTFSPDAKRIVAEEFGFPAMTVYVSAADAERQSSLPGTAVTFENALRAAMTSFLEDYSDIESPLGLMAEDAYNAAPAGGPSAAGYPPAILQSAREQLKRYLNRPSTRLRLMTYGQSGEHGESVKDNWIFMLQMEDYSDCLYWVVVDRAGVKPAYNYGFN